MTGYECEKCGASSLVRSNFRLLPDRRAWCRKPECERAFREAEGQQGRAAAGPGRAGP